MAQGRTDLTLQTTDEEIDGMACSTLTKHLRQKFGMTEEETELMKEEEARAELKKRMREARDKAKKGRCAGQPAGNQRELQAEHNRIRERLSQLCHDIAVFLPSLEASTKDILETQFGRAAEDILTDVQTQLQKDECPILVAGETSSGRTTFINKLVGEDIMPVPHSHTSTICEVKYGETRQAVVHLHHPTGPGHSQITIPLDGTQEQKLKSYIYLQGASRDQLPPAERVEIFWPLPLLKGGIVLVDSPGVGKSEMMDRVVADYIPKVFGLLYIIDSSIRGGVQQDRLEKLLQLWEEKNKDNFYPESAMFICNKWDQVPPEEEDKVKRETFAKLSEMLPGLEESQVFFVSTTDAVGPFGILSEDFTEVLDGLDLLLPNSLDNKLETQYRLLTEISSAALTHIDSMLNVARQDLDKDTKVERFKEAQKHFQSLEEEVKKSREELHRNLSRKMKSTKDKLSRIVRTGKLRQDLILNTFGAPNLIMKPLQLWHSDMLAKLQNEKKFTDNNNPVVKKDNFSLLKDFYAALANDLAKCPSFKDHVTSMENHFEQSVKEIVESLEDAHQQNVYDCEMRQMTVSDVLSHTPSGVRRFAAFWKGVSLSSLSRKLRQGKSKGAKAGWGSQSKTEELESILRNCWEEAPAGTPLVDILMQALSSSDELLTELAERQMQPQRDLMALLEADIKKMTTNMEQTVDQTFKDTRNNEEIVAVYQPQSTDINSFLGQLAMLHLTEMRKYEYDLDCITGWTDTRNRIGGGSFGEVYRVQVPWKGGETQEAALKLTSCNMITTGAGDALNFLKEGDNLRKLRGEHIVEYYGTACRREQGGLRLGLVMELCEGTLADRIIGNRNLNPAWWGSNPEKHLAAFRDTRNLAVQLCEGLRTIHDAGYIHRDLKLINVLVTKDDTVKLADVGLTKREDKITGTVAGTPLYTAPEVKERKVYDKSADIYSLGLILLEMWYGQLYGHQDAAYAKQMEEALKEGRVIEMPQWQGTDPPTREWTRLIHDCLKDPKERPKIQECLDRMNRMKPMHCQSFVCTQQVNRVPARSVQSAAGRQRDNRKGISGIERDSGATGQPTRREKSSRQSHHPREPTSSQTTNLTSSERTTSTRPKSSRGNGAAGRQRDNRKGISGIERDSAATALAHSREQSGKLLELQKQVTDIVRESHPSLNFIPEENKEADEKRIELNRKTLQEEVFSSDVNFSLEAVIYQLIERRMRSVCCINWPGGSGTGFLLSKGKVLTCNHVYKMMNRASLSFHEANHNTATFFVSVGSKYEVPLEAPAAMCICYSEDLDYAILQLAVSGEMERNLEGLPLLGQFISEGEDSRELVVLVGHPSGGSKVVDFARIAGVAEQYIIHIRYPNLIQEDKRKPIYDTSVMFHGSSGSPGFDTFGDVVLMHTRGFYPDSSKSVIERGTRLTAIRNHAREILAPEVFNEIFPDPPMSIG